MRKGARKPRLRRAVARTLAARTLAARTLITRASVALFLRQHLRFLLPFLSPSRVLVIFPAAFPARLSAPSQARRIARQMRLRILPLFLFRIARFLVKSRRSGAKPLYNDYRSLHTVPATAKLASFGKQPSSARWLTTTHDGPKTHGNRRRRNNATAQRHTARRTQHGAHERTFDGNGVLHFRYSRRI